MSDIVEVKYGRIFHHFDHAVKKLRDDILDDSSKVLTKEFQTSIRNRWFRTGATLNSLRVLVVASGDNKSFSIFPTATNKGAPYPLFGEYGTGRRGAVSGQPAPRGYKYGRLQGMAARRYGRKAVEVAKPQIEAIAKQLAANLTI